MWETGGDVGDSEGAHGFGEGRMGLQSLTGPLGVAQISSL